VQALRGGENQYAPLPGLQSLRDAVREHQRDRYGLEPEDVLVTFGATEAIAAALVALCDPVTRSWCWSRTTTRTQRVSRSRARRRRVRGTRDSRRNYVAGRRRHLVRRRLPPFRRSPRPVGNNGTRSAAKPPAWQAAGGAKTPWCSGQSCVLPA
jgi:hypothetical protein